MCVLALAWRASPGWRLVVAANRDELHARPTAPLDRWADRPGLIAGRDLVSGGTWLGVAETGRFAAVTNIAGPGAADPAASSRGALVVDLLTVDEAGTASRADPTRFNPCNFVAITGNEAWAWSNRPEFVRRALPPGVHGIANAPLGEIWPKATMLAARVAEWTAHGHAVGALLDRLGPPPIGKAAVPPRSAIFIRDPVYGTRCSTVVTIDRAGVGLIVERRFAADGAVTGETAFDFAWPAEEP